MTPLHAVALLRAVTLFVVVTFYFFCSFFLGVLYTQVMR